MAIVGIPPNIGGFADNILSQARNGAAPRGDLLARMVSQIQYRQHAGRPLLHWWGGWYRDGISYDTSGVAVFRLARHNALEGGGRHLRANVHCLPSADPSASTTAGVVLDGYTNAVGERGAGAYYANNLTYAKGLTNNDDDAISGDVEEVTIGFDNVRTVAGCLYEDRITNINPTDTVIDQLFGAGREILATQSGSYSTVYRLRDRLNHVHQNRTTQISWVSPDDSYLEVSTSPTEYRYIFDQTIGDGGADPAADGPAITVFNRYAGYGISTQVRVYLYVYAAMSGNTDGGTLAVANKDAGGTMGTMQPLTNPQTIGGTGYAWYPSLGTLSSDTGAYFLSPTTPAFDRICIGARSEGATDFVRIKAWTMIVYPVSD